jgi:hypothetical protein
MTKDDIGKGIATINNDVFITGTFRSPILNLGSINLNVSTAPFGIGDIFVAKLSGNCSSVSITQQSMTPSNAQIGSSILLDVIATGTPPISYQWYVSNYPISGANSSSYTTQAVTASQQGIFYNCSVSNCSYSNTFYTNNDSVLIKFPEGIGNSSIYNLGDNLLIYPNPSEKKIKIDCPKEINQIKVIDMIGHLVNHSLISGKSTSISIEKAGTYIMEISTNEGVFYRKIQITSN